MYNILESKIEFKNNDLIKVTVLVEMSKGDIRVIQADNKPKGGYMFLMAHHELNNDLLQEVAGRGMEQPFSKINSIFPRWKKYA